MRHRQSLATFVVWLLAGFGISFTQTMLAGQQVVGTNQYLCTTGQTLRCYDWPQLELSWENQDLYEPDSIAIQDNIIIAVSGPKLLAFELDNGEQIWSFAGNQRLFDPVIHQSIVYSTAINGQINAIDLETGKLVWQRQLDKSWVYPPVIAGQLLVTGGQSAELWGLDRVNGNTIWQYSFAQEIVYRPVTADDGSVYVSTFDAFLHKLDADSGGLIWSKKMPAAQHQLTQAGRDLMLSGGMDGAVHSINTSNGTINWSRWVGSNARFTLYNSSNILVTLSESGKLVSISMTNGQVLNTRHLEPAEGNRVFITADNVLIFSDDESVRRFPIPYFIRNPNNVAEVTSINHRRERQPL